MPVLFGRQVRPSSVGLCAVFIVAIATRVPGQEPSPTAGAGLTAALMDEGAAIFGTECTTCHGGDGSSDVGPALAGNASIATKDFVVKRLLEGIKDMPGFASSLTDRQMAAVATFIRNSWENAHGVLVESDVKRLRDEMKKKPAN